MYTLTFDSFKPAYSKAFAQLNMAWLEEYFHLEAYDRKVLEDPQHYIIDRGGHILVAQIEDEVLGVVALMPIENRTYELTKMAVSKDYRGQKIGQRLLRRILTFAKENLINTLHLYSNRKLENTIYIYRKYGFVEISLEVDNPYDRANIKMELKL